MPERDRAAAYTSLPLTDDRVVHVCACGWTGDWAEAFAHVVSERSDGHRIVSDHLPEDARC